MALDPEDQVSPEDLLRLIDQFTMIAEALKGLVNQVTAQGFTPEQAYQIVTDLIHAQAHPQGDTNDR